MTPCFADSFYFFAILNPRDDAHGAAISTHASLRRPLVTTAWGLAEIGDGLAHTHSRNLFPLLLDRLRRDSRVTIVPPSEELFDEGARLYESRYDKQWSLTDCISFIVMQRRGITDALTGDRHFEQAGFVAMLTSK